MEAAHESIVQRYNHLVDEVKDPASWAREMFAEDATFVLGNFPTSEGHEQIAAAAQGVYNLAAGLHHQGTKLHSVSSDLFVSEGTVTYTMPDGRILKPIPLVSVFELCPGTSVIQNYRAYLDVNPLFIAAGMDVTAGEDGAPTFVPRK